MPKNTPHMRNNRSPEVIEFSSRVAGEMHYARQTAAKRQRPIPPIEEPLSLKEYAQLCEEVFMSAGFGVEDALNSNLIEKRISDILNESSLLKATYPQGYAMLACILPFDEQGNPLHAEKIHSGEHIRFLCIDKADKKDDCCVAGFSVFPNHVYRLIPVELTALFNIPAYDSGDVYTVTTNDKQKLRKEMIEAAKRVKLSLK